MHDAIVPVVTYLLNQLIWKSEHKFSLQKQFGKAEKNTRKLDMERETPYVSICNAGLRYAVENDNVLFHMI